MGEYGVDRPLMWFGEDANHGTGNGWGAQVARQNWAAFILTWLGGRPKECQLKIEELKIKSDSPTCLINLLAFT